MMMFSNRFITRVSAGATTDLRGIHGIDHWCRVWRNAERLAEEHDDREVSMDFLALFALFHDTQRLNDEDDPKHGNRAAEYLECCYQAALKGDPGLSELADYPYHLIRAVKHACEIHTECQPGDEDDFGIGDDTSGSDLYKLCTKLCMDADRLDIWRVNGPVNADALFTDEAQRVAALEYVDGYPSDFEDQLGNIFPAPITHIADMTKAQRDTIRRLFHDHDDGCLTELDLLLRAQPSTDGAVTLSWCGAEVVVDPAGRPAAMHREAGPILRGLFGTADSRPDDLRHRRLYHYTSWQGLIAILAAGEIRPACEADEYCGGLIDMDHPLRGVWCSHAREIERALPGMPSIDACPTDREAQESYNMEHGLARIEVNPIAAPLRVGDDGDIPMCKLLLYDLHVFGSCAEDWRMGRSAIRSRDWFSIQEWSEDGGWESVELSKNPRVRAIWPLLPSWMLANPESELLDPDRPHVGLRLLDHQAQRFVDQFEAGRHHFWFLMARGEFNGALALAVAQAGQSAKLDGLSPLDKAACLCDLALYHRVFAHHEQAEMLTWDAARTLYQDARLHNVVGDLEARGIGPFLAAIVRESPSNPNMRGAEITVPVALFLSMGHRAGQLKEHADQICSALGEHLPRQKTASLMAGALSRWIGSGHAAISAASVTRKFWEPRAADYDDG